MTTAAEPTPLERSDPLDRRWRGRGHRKTSVLSEAARLSASLGCTVLSARGGVLEQTHGYGIVRQLLEEHQRAADSGP